MIDAPCSRKSFLTLGLCTLASGLVGCSEDPGTTPGAGSPSGGTTGGTGGGAGSTAGGGGGTAAGSGGGAGSSAGSSGSAGSAGSGGGSSGSGGGGGTGGGSAGGGSGGSGGGAGVMCNSDITALCLPSNGAPNGHTHELIITAAAITAGATMMFETEEDASNHTHTVELTSEDFTTLKAGGVVTKDTCGQGPHQFVISCGANPPAPMMPDCQ